MLKAAVNNLVMTAVSAGDLRDYIEPLYVLRALASVSTFAAGPGGESRSKRMVDILISGSRPPSS